MRLQFSDYPRPFAAGLAAVTLATSIWIEAETALAASALQPPAAPQQTAAQNASAASSRGPHQSTFPPLPTPNFPSSKPPEALLNTYPAAPIRPRLDFADRIATLHAIETALSSVADGGAFVWQRGNGHLRGLIRPTASFKSARGEVCRHVIIRLDSRQLSREVEGVACQSQTGVWSLLG